MPTATTFRQTVVAHLMAVLNARVSNSPDATQIAVAYRIRPPNQPVTPCGYIGDWTETIVHDSGTRTRFATTSVVLAATLVADSDQTIGELDVLTDIVVDALSAAVMASAATAGPIEPTAVDSGEAPFTEGGALHELVIITIKASVQEGRN